MADKYSNFAELAANETEGVHYRICVTDRGSPVAVIAPHGGKIERGTSQIAAAIAVNNFSLYCFEGLTKRPHCHLHITSDRFDEPRARSLVESCFIAVGIHGRKDLNDPETIWLGGRDTMLRDGMGKVLSASGFKVKTSGHSLLGEHPNNICNRGKTSAGLQFELPKALRMSLISDPCRLEKFAAIVRPEIERRVIALGDGASR